MKKQLLTGSIVEQTKTVLSNWAGCVCLAAVLVIGLTGCSLLSRPYSGEDDYPVDPGADESAKRMAEAADPLVRQGYQKARALLMKLLNNPLLQPTQDEPPSGENAPEPPSNQTESAVETRAEGYWVWVPDDKRWYWFKKPAPFPLRGLTN